MIPVDANQAKALPDAGTVSQGLVPLSQSAASRAASWARAEMPCDIGWEPICSLHRTVM